MEAKTKDKEYAYFQPGGMIYLLSSRSDQLMKAPPAQGTAVRPEPKTDTPAEQQIKAQAKELLKTHNKQQINDQTGGKNDKSFDEQVDDLIEWSNTQAKKSNLIIIRHKE